MNEEEVKIKYILPWLEQAGVDLHEIQLERTFSIKIGRQTITVAGSAKKDKAQGRLDILVKRGDKNLLIVEIKASHLTLTDDDRDQAISYARLVHPVAPYAVVSNGNEYRLYDSLTKELLEPSTIRIRGFEAALPEEDISKAQALFLRLNQKNLSLFCQSQVAGELRLVKGTLTEGRKYIPNLYVPRESIFKEIHKFYESLLPGLLLVGQSGSGKTCELCSIAESLLADGKPVLFFNGFSIENDIFDAVAKEFSWAFSGLDAPIETVKRVESLVREDFLTIIVDAIDEWTFKSRSNHLASLLKAAESRQIKVIVSCKTSAVEEFLSCRGNPTPTSFLTERIDVQPLSPKEFSQAVSNYRNTYQFYGGFENTVLELARENPFFLRVLFDVAKNSDVKHLTFSSSEFFQAYYKRSLQKTSDVRQAEETLKAVAELLYEYSVDWISESNIRNLLNLRVNEPLMGELFEYGILIRSLGDTEEPAIGFYFQQLRDYIIAFKVLQFSKMSTHQLEEEFKKVIFPSMRSDVFTLYYRLATQEHKLVFDGELRENATKYLHCYVSLIGKNFPSLKKSFKPGTDRNIGFIGELLLSQQSAGAYGFRPVGDSDDEVFFIPVQQVLGRSNILYLNGADELHLRSSALGLKNGVDIVREVVEGELLPQIRLFIEQGKLNESKNPDLLSEFISETVLHQRIFNKLLTGKQLAAHFPLKLDSIIGCLLREKLSRHYHDEICERKRKKGEVKERWNGTIVSYSYTFTASDKEEVQNKVEAALASGNIPTFKARHTELYNLELSLKDVFKALRPYGNEIEAPLFGGLREYILNDSTVMLTDELKDSLRKLFKKFLSNYRIIIDTNFPTFKPFFNLYSYFPVSIYIVLGSAIEGVYGNRSTPLSIYFVKAKSRQSIVKVVEEVVWDRSKDNFQFLIEGIIYDGIYELKTTVENLLTGMPGLEEKHFHGMILRKMVYGKLWGEILIVENAFRSQLALPTA